MLEAAVDALGVLLQIETLLWLLAGVVIGVTVGFLPGLGGSVGLAILLPFIYGMDPVNGLVLLMGITAISNTADTFPSVMMGVPGSASSQATIMDGYPMAKRGESTTALSAAFIASMVGGIIGGVALLGTIFIARPLVLALGTPELFMFTMIGLSMVGILSKGAAAAGLTAGFFGLLIGTIGPAPRVPITRYDFGMDYLILGIPLPVLAIGLFAIPEVVDLLARRQAISEVAEQRGSRMAGLKAVWQNKLLVLRSSVIGNVLGIIPGIGGNVIDWITYGIARQTCKNNENFGKGDVRGVIAPEAANNSKEGGVLLPTLLFGIPGSGSMALLLGGFIILGIQVGPDMVDRNLDTTLLIIWALVLANIAATSISLAMTGPIGKLATIPAARLMPFLIVVMTLASYQSRRSWGDIATLLAFGALGWAMKQIGMPRAPLLIGFVLATPAERFLGISMARYGFGWLLRPGVIVLGVLMFVLIAWGTRKGGSRLPATADATTYTEAGR